MSKFSKTRSGKELGSKQFFELIRSIGEAKSKQEEDKIITKEIASLKVRMSEKDVNHALMKEYVVRLLYCEMLGHQAEFGYIHCVNLIASADLLQKRTGYLAVQLTISPENELLYLVVSAIQKDLKSNSFLDVCCALTAATKLMSPELMPCIIEDVRKCLQTHELPIVRKKAIVCIHAFWRRNEMVVGDVKQYQQVLCDKDPSVMACMLPFLYDLCILKPDENKHLVMSFVNILKQICENCLSKEYEYPRNGVPAPWIQIKLLKLLAVLCHGDPVKSKEAAPQLAEVMKRSSTVPHIGHAVVFECVKTITCLEYDEQLMTSAAEAIAVFLQSTNPNLKYLGITSLSRIVLIEPSYAARHKEIVMDCLEDHDETIKRKTLDLLYAMTNEDNVVVIVARLLKFLSAAHDQYLKADLVNNITALAYTFLPSMDWYISTMNTVIKLGEQYVENQTVQGMLKMIAEGSDELEEDDNEQFRLNSVELYYQLLDSSDHLPETLIQIIAWVLGEYGFMSQKYKDDEIIDRMCDLLEKTYEQTDTRGYLITALMKLTSQLAAVPASVLELVGTFKNSSCLALQQRCYEFLELANHSALMSEVLPLDGCCEDLLVDPGLSVLDAVVEKAREAGLKMYRKKEEGFATVETGTELKTAEYANPQSTAPPPADAEPEPEAELTLNVQNVRWKADMLAPEKEDDAPLPQQEEMESDEEDGAPSPMAAAAPVEVLKEKKKKKTEKEKLADMLFADPAAAKKEKKERKAEKERRKAEKAARKNMPVDPASSPVHSPGEEASPQAAQAAQVNYAALAQQLTPITKEQVGNLEKMWAAHPHEVSDTLPLPIPNIDLEQLAARIQQVSNVAKVETIGREFIAASRHQTGLVLGYFVIAEKPTDHLGMKIRSTSPELSQAVINLLKTQVLGQA